MKTKEIKEHLRKGEYAWPGGYPLYFVTSDGCALSFEAVRAEWRQVCYSARNNISDGWRIHGVAVNWEYPDLYCEHTGKRIESAYAESA